MIVLFSFNDNKGRFNFTWQGFTLEHWKHPFGVDGPAAAFTKSLSIAALDDADRDRARDADGARARPLPVPGPRRRRTCLIFLPLATPEVVLGAALLGWLLTLAFARGLHDDPDRPRDVLLSFVVVTVRARLMGFDLHIEEAAQDLGANQCTTFRKITLPLIMPGRRGRRRCSRSRSRSTTSSSRTSTPGRRSRSRCTSSAPSRQGVPPQVNVLATMLLLVVIALMVLNLLWQRRAAKRDARACPRSSCRRAERPGSRVGAMRAVVITKHGGPEVLQVAGAARPAAAARARSGSPVAAAGVNFADTLARVGLYPDAPNALRRRLRGRGHGRPRSGEGVTPLAVGDRVLAGTRFGGYAELVVVPRGRRDRRCPTR